MLHCVAYRCKLLVYSLTLVYFFASLLETCFVELELFRNLLELCPALPPRLAIQRITKGTVARDFLPSVFSLTNPPRPLTNGLKLSRIWLRIRRDITLTC
jgi:hypothetical protein